MPDTMPSERVQRRIDGLLDQAEEAVESLDWERVREAAGSVLVVDAENEDARSFLQMADHNLDGSQSGSSEAGGQAGEITGDGDDAGEPDTPTSFANGRYQVTGFLGEGGKKKVYLVHDTTLDRDVAFGLIKAEGLDEASRQRITREAQAMARLGDNPNIMPIFDLGEENGQPYMVGPLMGGGDVEGLIEDAEDGRLSLEDALRIASEVCSGLEFAHSKSIIHRDLKPGNVWLTDDGTARIGDFGLAISLDRSRLTQEKMMVGTVSYMPPEQATGGEITPRADLYSLGAMLYEMVTGRPPFMGDDEIAIIGQHINTPPVAPSWHNQSLPQTLDSLIMRLLAKDPAERPESAAEVLQALEAIDPTDAAAVHEEEQGSLDSMSGGVFVGRHREMDQLKATFEDTLGGHGKMVALVGEPGIGKTRTAQELATYASMRGGQVLWGRCYESGGAPPYWPWVQAIRSYVMDRDAETVRREMGSTASVIAEIVPDVKERLPDLQAPPQIDDPESARFRLFDSISTFLRTASGSQPIVLMLEDLHWSDKPSLLLLEFITRELGNSRLMIVGNYRDMELNRRHPLSITLGELSRERLFDRVLLRGLQKHDVQRFIEVAAGIDPPSALVDAVYTQTEGNPLFVAETVRLLIQEGDIASGIRTEGGTSSWEIRIPEGVREVIGRRLDRLSERCNEVLTTAAVIGRQFRFGVLMKLIEDASENTLLDALDEALDARIVEEIPSEVGLYQFAHALMQETLTSELSANRAVRLHARIAEALEEFYGDEVGEHAAELAEHFAEAETILGPDRLIRYSTVAGEIAAANYAWEEALGHFERAFGAREGSGSEKVNGAIDDEAAQILERIGQAQIALALRQEAGITMRKVYKHYVATGNFARAADAICNRDIAESELITEALSLVAPESHESGKLLAWHGFFLGTAGNSIEAKKAFESATEIAERENDPVLALRVMVIANELDLHMNRYGQEMVDLGKRYIEVARAAADKLAEADAQIQTAWQASYIGDPDTAREHADNHMELALELRLRPTQRLSLGISSSIARSLGDFSKAREQAKQGFALDRHFQFLGRLADVEFETGNIVEGHLWLSNLRDEVFVGDATMASGPRGHGLAILIRTVAAARRFGADSDLIAEIADMVGRRDWRGLPVRTDDPNLQMAMVLLKVQDGDSTGLEELLTSLKPMRPFFITPYAHVARIMGLGFAELKNYQEAEELFREAVDFCRDATYKPELAWTCHDYAEMLLGRDVLNDREKATELQDEAIAIATELGMQPLLERVLAQREILKA